MQGNGKARSVIVTGAAGVLGQAMTAALVKAGHRVLLTDRSEDALKDLAERSKATKGAIAVCAADLTSVDGPVVIEKAALDAFGRIDMLINNAAFTAFAAWPDSDQPNAWELDTELVRQFFDINFIAQHALTSRVIPGMIEQGWGRIVNISCSYNTMQRLYPYGATKAALEAYTAALQTQLRETKVTANTLNPGGPVFFPAHVAANPGLNWVQPEIMDAPILWLASDESNGVPGRRYVAVKWTEGMTPEIALQKAAGPMSWRGFGAEAI